MSEVLRFDVARGDGLIDNDCDGGFASLRFEGKVE